MRFVCRVAGSPSAGDSTMACRSTRLTLHRTRCRAFSVRRLTVFERHRPSLGAMTRKPPHTEPQLQPGHSGCLQPSNARTRLREQHANPKGDLWTASRAIVLYRNGKRASVVVPERQATVGWAFRDGGKSIAVSTQGTHGPTGLGLYDVATGQRIAKADGTEGDPSPKWMQGEKLLFCCRVRATMEVYRE